MPPTPTGMETIYNRPDEVESRYLVADGYRTHYRVSGNENNRPVVLVHGANFDFGLGGDRWFPTMVPLGREFFVIAPDELGGGDTDPPRDIADIGHIRVRANHLIAFLDELGLGKVDLVGQSQGAWIAAYIAIKRPDLVDRFILVDSASLAVPSGGIDNTHIHDRFSEQFIPDTMINLKIAAGDIEAGVRQWLESMVYSPEILIDPYFEACLGLAEKWVPIWQKPWEAFWKDGGEKNREQYLYDDGKHLREHVQKLDKPFIVWGRNSVKGLQNGVDLFQRIPDSQFHVYDKADHFLWQDQWRDFNSLITYYLKDGR